MIGNRSNALTRLPDRDAVLGDDRAAAAAACAALGLAVIPLHTINEAGQCSCGKACGRDAGKHPRTPNGLLNATHDPRVIGGWWRRWPDANVAVATGTRSGVWVLDVDPAHGGEESLTSLEAEHGNLEPTWCVETGGGGFHLWFRLDGAAISTSAGRFGAGLDVRGDGGYVVVPPSRHRTGRAYGWADAWNPNLVDLAPAPPWLLGLVQEPRPAKMVPPDRSPIGKKLGGNHSQPLPEVIEEGARNAALTSLAGAMCRKGAGERAIVAALLVENTERCRPMLAEHEVARIVRSVCRYAPADEARLVRSAHRPRGFVEFVDGQAVAR